MQAITPISDYQIEKYAPSSMATAPMDGASSKYTFVPTMEVIDIIKSKGWIPYHAKETKTRKDEKKGFQKHMIRFSRGEMLGNLGDERFDLILHNSHDRGSSFKLNAGVFRLICTNGLVIGNTSMSYSHRHVGFSKDDFVKSIDQISEQTYAISEKVQGFKEIELTPSETGVFAMSAARLISDEPEEIDLNDLVRARRYDDVKPDLWTTYNRVQENVMTGGVKRWGKTKSGRDKKRTRRVNSIDRDIKLNMALWTLTEEMAKIKKG